jgi:hypothetical protein
VPWEDWSLVVVLLDLGQVWSGLPRATMYLQALADEIERRVGIYTSFWLTPSLNTCAKVFEPTINVQLRIYNAALMLVAPTEILDWILYNLLRSG